MMKKFCIILILTLGLCNIVKYFPILAYNALVCNTAVSFKNSTKKAAYRYLYRPDNAVQAS